MTRSLAFMGCRSRFRIRSKPLARLGVGYGRGRFWRARVTLRAGAFRGLSRAQYDRARYWPK